VTSARLTRVFTATIGVEQTRVFTATIGVEQTR
jgi:hypothetical protein